MKQSGPRFASYCLLLLAALAGCVRTEPDPPATVGPGGTPPAGTAEPRISGPTTPVNGGSAVPAELAQAVTAASATDGPALLASYSVEVEARLGFDPSSAQGLDLIQASPLKLSPAQLDKLSANGLVIAKNRHFPSFIYGYRSIYGADLPVFVSADSILNAVHHSFDKVLETVEIAYIIPELQRLLQEARTSLPTLAVDERTQQDLDLYLGVAKSLLDGQLAAPIAGADSATLSALVVSATAASGHGTTSLFGAERDEDFSQFKPRGHYTHSEPLKQYFRAMMWLGRVDLRVVETLTDGEQVFRRPQFDAAVALYEALGEKGRAHWANVDEVVGLFVGERDSASISDMAALLEELQAPSFQASKALTDQQIIAAIGKGSFGAQLIASRILIANRHTGTLPLDRAFALFGQRYTVDSHVFVNTTYDRVEARMMPSPLDVGFAALGNGTALGLLAPGLGNQSYAGGLAKTRVLIDAHEAPYWEGSLYTQWLGALRALSPRADDRETLPSVALTPAFRERILNTQLASWAELRRDTILYAKQSYTLGVACEFPDAYVDPYPEFYARLGRFAERLQQISTRIPNERAGLANWADNFIRASGYLERMARNQRSGTPHGPELLAFVNDAVRWDESTNCDGSKLISNLNGWYTRLFYSPQEALEFDPTIADVHTQPTDEAGADVGRVLHVGTGYARTMVVAVNTCSGPRAYVGLASSYAEKTTDSWTRLNDQEWAEIIKAGGFNDVPWMQRVLGD